MTILIFIPIFIIAHQMLIISITIENFTYCAWAFRAVHVIINTFVLFLLLIQVSIAATLLYGQQQRDELVLELFVILEFVSEREFPDQDLRQFLDDHLVLIQNFIQLCTVHPLQIWGIFISSTFNLKSPSLKN